MLEHSIYFAIPTFYDTIRKVGGQWNDAKERPLVCLIQSKENPDLYWAIPIGNWNHRNETAKSRIQKYLSFDQKDIRSCFYHIGKTDQHSIFFLSDVVPITDKYIDRAYIGTHTQQIYTIKNKPLLEALKMKLSRILSWEAANPNYFRQHITDVKLHLLSELQLR